MLKDSLVPTRLIDPATRAPVRIGTNDQPPRFRRLLVLKHLLRLLWGTLSLAVTGRLTRTSYARLFRKFLDDSGGLWIKVGQLLSYRVDIFSAEFCRELAGLQARAVGFAPEVARRIIEEELGAPIERYFDEFHDKPFAAASIGQIHRAHLRLEGRWVAVKVQRPYLEETFNVDLAMIQVLVRVLHWISFRPFMRWDEGLRELRQMMREELDCRYEAGAFKRMRKSLRKHRVYVPKVFSSYNRKRILVTEFVHATLMADYIYMAGHDPARLSAWLAENNIEPRIVARRLIQSNYRQIFEDNLYHGDLHPGNIILLRDSRLALIDFGAIAFTESEYLHRFRIVFHALATHDYAKAADTSLLLGGRVRASDIELVRNELIEALRDWGTRVAVLDLPYHERNVDSAVVEITRIMTRHRCEVKWSLLRIRRAAAALDASLTQLYPEIDVYKQMLRHIRGMERRSIRKALREMGRNAIRGAVAGQQATNVIFENASFQGTTIRRQAQVFEATTSKFAYLMAVFFAQLALLQGLAGLLFVVAFLEQHHPALARLWVWERFAEFARRLPPLDYPVWIGVILIITFFTVNSFNLSRRFAAREAQVPDDSMRV